MPRPDRVSCMVTSRRRQAATPPSEPIAQSRHSALQRFAIRIDHELNLIARRKSRARSLRHVQHNFERTVLNQRHQRLTLAATLAGESMTLYHESAGRSSDLTLVEPLLQ